MIMGISIYVIVGYPYTTQINHCIHNDCEIQIFNIFGICYVHKELVFECQQYVRLILKNLNS